MGAMANKDEAVSPAPIYAIASKETSNQFAIVVFDLRLLRSEYLPFASQQISIAFSS